MSNSTPAPDVPTCVCSALDYPHSWSCVENAYRATSESDELATARAQAERYRAFVTTWGIDRQRDDEKGPWIYRCLQCRRTGNRRDGINHAPDCIVLEAQSQAPCQTPL